MSDQHCTTCVNPDPFGIVGRSSEKVNYYYVFAKRVGDCNCKTDVACSCCPGDINSSIESDQVWESMILPCLCVVIDHCSMLAGVGPDLKDDNTRTGDESWILIASIVEVVKSS